MVEFVEQSSWSSAKQPLSCIGNSIYHSAPNERTCYNNIFYNESYVLGHSLKSQWQFHSSVSKTLYFENSAEEFYPHETISTPIKLSSSFSSSI